MLINKDGLSKNWQILELKDVCDFLDHKRKPVTQKDRIPGPYPYYGANGQQDSVNNFIFDEPLVLLAEDGGHFGDPHKTIAYPIQGKSWVNNHAHVLRPKDNIDIRYLYRHLEKYDVTPFITGTTRAKLTKAAASCIPIALPPIAEQKRIAAILDKADGVRRKRREAIRLTEELARSLFLDMFGDPVTNPKGWDVVPMKKAVQETQYGTSQKSNTDQKGLPILRMNNLTYSGEIDLSDLKWCDIPDRDKDKYTVKKGDLLFNRTNSPELVGKTAIWDKDQEFAFAGYLIRVRFNESKAHPAYISGYLNSNHGKRFLLSKAKPSINMSNFSASEFVKIPILLPPISEQKRFADLLSYLGNYKESLKSAILPTENLFNSLLHRAFRGDL